MKMMKNLDIDLNRKGYLENLKESLGNRKGFLENRKGSLENRKESLGNRKGFLEGYKF